MPELPEVEVIARILKKKLKNKILKKVKILDKKILRDKFSFAEIKDKKLISLQRRGKYIIFYFQNKKVIFHLGMSGRIALNSIPDKYTRVILEFKNCKVLLQDKRKFSSVYGEEKFLNKLGIEPLSKEFTLNYLKKELNKSKQNIKGFLMDQRKIAGIGNIYAQEILFSSKVSPFKKANELSNKEIVLIYKNLKRILNKAIEWGGTTISDYRNAEDKEGKYYEKLKVYKREDMPCVRCKNKIRRTKQNGRSTYFCEVCQRR